MPKVSLILTIKNEEGSIRQVIEGLLAQTRCPDEIVVVDGGSGDATVSIIREYVDQGYPIHLAVEPGASVARGRNLAVRASRHPVLAVTDAGCRAHPDWLRNLTAPFEREPPVDVVCGFYEPECHSAFERILAEFTFPKREHVNPDTFMPSSRSVAFTREAWERVGGYPEDLRSAEDTMFDLALRDAGVRHAFAGDAVVYWRPRSSLWKFLKQSAWYAQGDGQANLFLIWNKESYFRFLSGCLAFATAWVSPWYGGALLLIWVAALLDRALGLFRHVRDWRAFLWVPLMAVALDLGRVYGYSLGWLQVGRRRPSPRFASPYLRPWTVRERVVRPLVSFGSSLLRASLPCLGYAARSELLAVLGYLLVAAASLFRLPYLGYAAGGTWAAQYLLRRARASYRARIGRVAERNLAKTPERPPTLLKEQSPEASAVRNPAILLRRDRYIAAGRLLARYSREPRYVLYAGTGDSAFEERVRDWLREGQDQESDPISPRDGLATGHRRGPRVSVAEPESLPHPPGYFDAVLCLEALSRVRRPHVALFEMSRVLRPGGVFLCAVPSQHYLAGSWNPLSLLEVALGVAVPFVLCPYHHLGLRPEDHSIHRHYTVQKLTRMCSQQSLEVISVQTLAFGITHWLLKLWTRSGWDTRALLRVDRHVLSRIPIMGRLGTWILLIARRKPYLSEPPPGRRQQQ